MLYDKSAPVFNWPKHKQHIAKNDLHITAEVM